MIFQKKVYNVEFLKKVKYFQKLNIEKDLSLRF